MSNASKSASLAAGIAAQSGEPGGGKSDTAAGKLADRPPQRLARSAVAPSKKFLQENAAMLLRREGVGVDDMKRVSRPVRPVRAGRKRKK